MKKNTGFKEMLLLQGIFFIYSLTSVVSKLTSERETGSLEFMILYGLDLVIFGIYALLWQQVIKKLELSVAYANKAVTLLWTLFWGVFIFHEEITVAKTLGILLVMAGIWILNTGRETQACIVI